MITPQEFWNRRSAVYDEQVGPLYRQAYDDTVACSLAYLHPEDRVLEFACGTGIVTRQIAPHVASLRAIDISGEMVKQAEAKFSADGLTNIDLSQTDLFDPCLQPGSFDAVLAYNVLLYVEDPDRVLQRIRSLLKPGGWFLSATDCLGGRPTKDGIRKFWKSRTGAMPYVAFFTQKSLTRTIAARFTVAETKNLFPAPPNLFVAAKAD